MAMAMAPRCRRLAMAAVCFLALSFSAAPAYGARALPPRAAAPGVAQQQGNGTTSAAGDEYLAPQNKARAAVAVPPLRWSADLAAAAAKIASQQQQQGRNCGFADLEASQYGGNQGWTSHRAPPAEVVGLWVEEGKYYNHGNNSCAAGQQCGTYTQVVWRRTAEAGCAQASCGTGATLTLCLYNPPGNVRGQSPY